MTFADHDSMSSKGARLRAVRWTASAAIALLVAFEGHAAAIGASAVKAGSQKLAQSPDTPAPKAAWTFDPGYSLPRRAEIRPQAVEARPTVMPMPAASSQFFGMTATDRRDLTVTLPSGPFSIEMWVVDHVNQPVGALIEAGGKQDNAWVLGYRSGEAVFGPLGTDRQPLIQAKSKKGFKERWRNLVGVWDGAHWRLYLNGELAGQVSGRGSAAASNSLVLSGYFQAERFMTLPNLVKAASVYDRALSGHEVQALFARRARLVEEGRLTDEALHFTQPPYLNVPTTSSIELSWETDRPVAATVEWGETSDSLQKRTFAIGAARLGGMKIEGLKADTPYFYRVTGTDEAGNRLESGLLSFRTAPVPGAPFTIAISADPEARPHINNRMSQLIWEERPNLLLLAGDLTDGGSKDKRFEWTHEYFAGMGPLFGRVPVIAAPGNGESELKWFRHYHRQPGDETYFSHRYGDVEIFVLDSNLDSRERREPGFRDRQRTWLAKALAASTAKWKFAIHHHPDQSSDDDDYGDSWTGRSTAGESEVQADFRPLYEKFGVDLVIVGHLHSYERSWPLTAGRLDPVNGVTYLQVGGLGGNLEDFQPTKPGFNRKTFRDHHYVMLRGAADRLEIEAFDAEGHLRDSFALTKSAPRGADRSSKRR